MKRTLLLLDRTPASSFNTILRIRIVSEIIESYLVVNILSTIQLQLNNLFFISPNQGCGETNVMSLC